MKRNEEKRWFKAILDIIREHRACALASVTEKYARQLVVQMPSGQLRSMPEVLALTTFSDRDKALFRKTLMAESEMGGGLVWFDGKVMEAA